MVSLHMHSQQNPQSKLVTTDIAVGSRIVYMNSLYMSLQALSQRKSIATDPTPPCHKYHMISLMSNEGINQELFEYVGVYVTSCYSPVSFIGCVCVRNDDRVEVIVAYMEKS